MKQITGTVATPNAARYVRQLCSHWGHKHEVEQGENTGTIHLPMGSATLTAADNEMQITLQGADKAATDRLKHVLQVHIDRFAFREVPLDYRWSDGEGVFQLTASDVSVERHESGSK